MNEKIDAPWLDGDLPTTDHDTSEHWTLVHWLKRDGKWSRSHVMPQDQAAYLDALRRLSAASALSGSLVRVGSRRERASFTLCGRPIPLQCDTLVMPRWELDTTVVCALCRERMP